MIAGARRLFYLDASALVKLVISEPETGALWALLADGSMLASSLIAEVELRRAAARQSTRSAAGQIDSVLASALLIRLEPAIARAAGEAAPASLRSLDAIHLASALSVQDELSAFVTYDLRQADAARAAGLNVIAPGQA